MLAWRVRIVVLWIALAMCQSASIGLLLQRPGALRDLAQGRLDGQDVQTPAAQLTTLLAWLVPMVMAYLTLVLRDADCRGTNLVLGAGGLLYGITNLVPPPQWTAATALLAALGTVVVPGLILWHAWKWPRPDGMPVGRH
ncbi:hypothetical protein GCM10027517_19080 [Phycicoccus ginsengisoli]